MSPVLQRWSPVGRFLLVKIVCVAALNCNSSVAVLSSHDYLRLALKINGALADESPGRVEIYKTNDQDYVFRLNGDLTLKTPLRFETTDEVQALNVLNDSYLRNMRTSPLPSLSPHTYQGFPEVKKVLFAHFLTVLSLPQGAREAQPLSDFHMSDEELSIVADLHSSPDTGESGDGSQYKPVIKASAGFPEPYLIDFPKSAEINSFPFVLDSNSLPSTSTGCHLEGVVLHNQGDQQAKPIHLNIHTTTLADDKQRCIKDALVPGVVTLGKKGKGGGGRRPSRSSMKNDQKEKAGALSQGSSASSLAGGGGDGTPPEKKADYTKRAPKHSEADIKEKSSDRNQDTEGSLAAGGAKVTRPRRKNAPEESKKGRVIRLLTEYTTQAKKTKCLILGDPYYQKKLKTADSLIPTLNDEERKELEANKEYQYCVENRVLSPISGI